MDSWPGVAADPGALEAVVVIAIVGGLLLGAIYLLTRPELPLVILAVLCAVPVILGASKFYDWRDARANGRKAKRSLPKLPPEPWEVEENARWNRWYARQP